MLFIYFAWERGSLGGEVRQSGAGEA